MGLRELPMRIQVLYQSRTRIRIHVLRREIQASPSRRDRSRLSMEEGDRLEIYLKTLPGVGSARVHERIGNAILTGQDLDIAKIREALERFSFDFDLPLQEKERTDRKVSSDAADKAALVVMERAGLLLLPSPLRTGIAVIKSLVYLVRGMRKLLRHRGAGALLDAAGVLLSLVMMDFETASSLLFLINLGDILKEWTRRKSEQALASALSQNRDKVWLEAGGVEVLVDPDSLKEGDVIVLRQGSFLPFDAVLLQGEGTFDASSLTGVKGPLRKGVGDFLFAGSLLIEGECRVSLQKIQGGSYYSRMLSNLSESFRQHLHFHENASRFRVLNLATLLFAMLSGVLGGDRNRALSVILADIPSAVSLTVPIAVSSAMNACAERSVAVQNGNALMLLCQVDTVIFNKRGVITEGIPRVVKVDAFGEMREEEALSIAACLEEHYPHSVALAVTLEAQRRGLVHASLHEETAYIRAHGISSYLGQGPDRKKVVLGSWHFVLEDEKAEPPGGSFRERFETLRREKSTHLYLAVDGRVQAVISLEDAPLPETARVIRELHSLGIRSVILMTGDSEHAARESAKNAGFDQYYAGMSEEDKLRFVQREMKKHRVSVIGDSIDDAPSLYEADVGIAVSTAVPLARSAADLILPERRREGQTIQGGIGELPALIRLSRSLNIRAQNARRTAVFGNALLALLGAGGLLSPYPVSVLHNLWSLGIGVLSLSKPGGEREIVLPDAEVMTMVLLQEEP